MKRLSYLNIPEMKEQYALPVFERNARLYLLERKDYVEGKSPNISYIRTESKVLSRAILCVDSEKRFFQNLNGLFDLIMVLAPS